MEPLLKNEIDAVKWRSLSDLEALLKGILPDSCSNLSKRLKRALPDEFGAAVDEGTLQCLLVDATPVEFGRYRFEVKIKASPISIPGLDMELRDFKVSFV